MDLSNFGAIDRLPLVDLWTLLLAGANAEVVATATSRSISRELLIGWMVGEGRKIFADLSLFGRGGPIPANQIKSMTFDIDPSTTRHRLQSLILSADQFVKLERGLWIVW